MLHAISISNSTSIPFGSFLKRVFISLILLTSSPLLIPGFLLLCQFSRDSYVQKYSDLQIKSSIHLFLLDLYFLSVFCFITYFFPLFYCCSMIPCPNCSLKTDITICLLRNLSLRCSDQISLISPKLSISLLFIW